MNRIEPSVCHLLPVVEEEEPDNFPIYSVLVQISPFSCGVVGKRVGLMNGFWVVVFFRVL